jgi:hypothetical protein
MPIKKVAHRATIVKKGGNKMALKWVPSSFEESDLKKAKKDGFLPEAAPVISPAMSAFPRRQKDIGLCSLPSFSVAFLSLPTSFFVGVQLHQLTPNLILHIACFITLCESFLGIDPHWVLWKFFSASAQAFL